MDTRLEVCTLHHGDRAYLDNELSKRDVDYGPFSLVPENQMPSSSRDVEVTGKQ